jgi:hypothetical protein
LISAQSKKIALVEQNFGIQLWMIIQVIAGVIFLKEMMSLLLNELD